jgi:hypothetical protein
MPDLSPETADLLFLGLDHGIDSVRGGGPLIPFVITERNGDRTLARFVEETLEAGIERAIASIRAAPIAPGDRSVLVYDGYLTLPDGDRSDAIYAEALEADGVVTVMAQRYRPKRRLRGLETIGNPALLPSGQSKL